MLWDSAVVKGWECLRCSASWAALSPYCWCIHLTLKQRNEPTKAPWFLWSLLLQCYSSTDGETCKWLWPFYSSPFHSVRMFLFWMQTCHVIRHMVICRPPVTVAFTRHSHADLPFLQTELVLHICLLPESFLFPAYLSFPCGCWDKWAFHSQWLIEYTFFGGGSEETHWCIYAWWSRTQ